jgi:hypothetical protein
LIVEQEVGPRVPPLIVVVVVAEPVVIAIVDEAGFFPCFKAIIARMTHITANFARHVCAIILAISMLLDASNFFMRRSILAAIMSIP